MIVLSYTIQGWIEQTVLMVGKWNINVTCIFFIFIG